VTERKAFVSTVCTPKIPDYWTGAIEPYAKKKASSRQARFGDGKSSKDLMRAVK